MGANRRVFTAMVLWTRSGRSSRSSSAIREPYAAATRRLLQSFGPASGEIFARELVVIGLISMLCSFLSLDMVIQALLTTRILVPFIGQIFADASAQTRPRNEPALSHVALSPAVFVALAVWLFLFATSGVKIIAYGVGSLLSHRLSCSGPGKLVAGVCDDSCEIGWRPTCPLVLADPHECQCLESFADQAGRPPLWYPPCPRLLPLTSRPSAPMLHP